MTSLRDIKVSRDIKVASLLEITHPVYSCFGKYEDVAESLEPENRNQKRNPGQKGCLNAKKGVVSPEKDMKIIISFSGETTPFLRLDTLGSVLNNNLSVSYRTF